MRNSSLTTCIRRLGGCRVAPCAALLLGAACGNAASPGEVGQRSLDIIGGYRADSPWLDHTGALALVVAEDGSTVQVCTATLIGPETVVTARHCVGFLPGWEQSGGGVAWAIGPDAGSPLQVIPVASIETAPDDVGGFVGQGRDVAVLHLDHPSDIPPAVPRPFGAEFVGTPMVLLGYGVHGAGYFSEQKRRIGRQTVAAVEGRVFEHLLGSFENFVEWSMTGSATDADYLSETPIDEEALRLARLTYDKALLFEQQEAIAGLAPSDSQSCFGDSGGPLGRMAEGGAFETYGVVSGGIPSTRSVCDYGGIFSMFGPVSFAFLEQALEWVDPCGDETREGRCDGDVARRCDSNLVSATRRIVSEDCALEGLRCVASDVGVGCGSVPAPDLENVPDDSDLEAALQAARDASRPELARSPEWSIGTGD